MIVFLDKLTFPQTVKVYRLYQQYYLIGKNSVESCELCNEAAEQRSVSPSGENTYCHSVDVEKSSISSASDMEKTGLGSNMEIISVITQNPFTNPIVALFGVTPTP